MKVILRLIHHNKPIIEKKSKQIRWEVVGSKCHMKNVNKVFLVIVCPPSKMHVVPMTMHDIVNNATRVLRVNITFTIFQALLIVTKYNNTHKQVHLVFNLL
jgi:hypothetical protein